MSFCLNPQFSSVRSYGEASLRLSLNQGFSKRHAEQLVNLGAAGAHHERALDGRKRHMTLRLLTRSEINDLYAPKRLDVSVLQLKHIAFRLHRTDVVVWREDDACIIHRYGSTSTNIFASLLTPVGVHSHFSLGGACGSNPYSHDLVVCDTFVESDSASYYYWGDNKRVYRMKGSRMILGRRPSEASTADSGSAPSGEQELGLTREWSPLDEDQIEPWMVPVIDRKLARLALAKTRYHEFIHWASAYVALEYGRNDIDYHRASYGRGRHITYEEMLEALEQGPTQGWRELVTIRYYWPAEPSSAWVDYQQKNALRYRWAYDPKSFIPSHIDRLGHALRLACYRGSPGTLEERPTPFLGSLRELSNVLRRCRYYGTDA